MKKKSKARYSEQKTKKNTRDVISYEDVPLEDYEQEKTEISPVAVKKIIISVCVALAAGLIVFAFANREKLTWENLSTWWTYDVLGNAGNGYPVEIVGSEVAAGNFTVSSGHVAYASDTSFVTLNSTGSEIANIQLRYSSPVLKADGNRFLTYGLGSTGFQVDGIDGQLYISDAEDNIYTGDINSNGTYCLVTEGNGYLSTVYVFNKDNNRIYKYSFSEYYITSIALNSSGTGCVAAGITADSGAPSVGIYVLDFTKEAPVSLYKISNDMIIDCEYLNGDSIAMVGESAAYTFKIKDEELKSISYGDKILTNYAFNPDTNSFTLALSSDASGRDCSLNSYNSKGEEICSFETKNKAESLSMYKNAISVLDGNNAYVYNTDGQLIYTADTGTGSKQLILTSDSSAYILSVNQIRFFDFKNPSTADTALNTSENEQL